MDKQAKIQLVNAMAKKMQKFLSARGVARNRYFRLGVTTARQILGVFAELLGAEIIIFKVAKNLLGKLFWRVFSCVKFCA